MSETHLLKVIPRVFNLSDNTRSCEIIHLAENLVSKTVFPLILPPASSRVMSYYLFIKHKARNLHGSKILRYLFYWFSIIIFLGVHLWSYFLEVFYLVTCKFIKNSQHINVSWCHWMVSFHLCLNAGSLKTFCSPGGKPRGILAEVSWRLANLIKYCTMKHCLQLWLNCILIYFQICFCIYLSCKQLPKVRLLYREELWFPFCEGMYLCSIFAVFYFL